MICPLARADSESELILSEFMVFLCGTGMAGELLIKREVMALSKGVASSAIATMHTM